MKLEAPTLLGLVLIVIIISITALTMTQTEVPSEYTVTLGTLVTAFIGLITKNPLGGDGNESG